MNKFNADGSGRLSSLPFFFFCLFVSLLISSVPVCAQSLSAQNEKLHQLFREFRYQEVIRLAEQTLETHQDLSVPQRCEILRLLALSYYSRQDMQGALKNFAEILTLDEHYRLDPLENSPKILAFFEEIRRQKQLTESKVPPPSADSLAAARVYLIADSVRQSATLQMTYSLVLPGYGQVNRGEKLKGWLLLAGNFTLLGSALYFTAETNRLEKKYLQVTDPDKINGAWENYNRAYKSRNLFLSAFAVLWLYTQIDYIFHAPSVNRSRAISCYPVIDTTGRTLVAIEVPF